MPNPDTAMHKARTKVDAVRELRVMRSRTRKRSCSTCKAIAENSDGERESWENGLLKVDAWNSASTKPSSSGFDNITYEDKEVAVDDEDKDEDSEDDDNHGRSYTFSGLDEEDDKDVDEHITPSVGEEEKELPAGITRVATAAVSINAAKGFPKLSGFLGRKMKRCLQERDWNPQNWAVDRKRLDLLDDHEWADPSTIGSCVNEDGDDFGVGWEVAVPHQTFRRCLATSEEAEEGGLCYAVQHKR